jgi:ketosteroid isomerase-like protein
MIKEAPMSSVLKFPLFLLAACGLAQASPRDDALAVANMDIAYQAAVLAGDADTMARTFHEDFILVTGRGVRSNARDWLAAAREGHVQYEHQETIDDSRSVKVDGDTAVVTAKLWIKGRLSATNPSVVKGEAKAGDAFNRVLWYSDTYVRTRAGWKYYFGQASLALPGADSIQTR